MTHFRDEYILMAQCHTPLTIFIHLPCEFHRLWDLRLHIVQLTTLQLALWCLNIIRIHATAMPLGISSYIFFPLCLHQRWEIKQWYSVLLQVQNFPSHCLGYCSRAVNKSTSLWIHHQPLRALPSVSTMVQTTGYRGQDEETPAAI